MNGEATSNGDRLVRKELVPGGGLLLGGCPRAGGLEQLGMLGSRMAEFASHERFHRMRAVGEELSRAVAHLPARRKTGA